MILTDRSAIIITQPECPGEEIIEYPHVYEHISDSEDAWISVGQQCVYLGLKLEKY